MRAGADLSAVEARWLAIGAQGLGKPRPKGTVGRRHVHNAIETVGTLQLDAINVVARTQFLVLFSRLGAYDPDHLHSLTGPGGELFEYWGHAASLVPMAAQPLFRWRMAHAGATPLRVARREEYRKANAKYIAAVLAEVRDRGPLTAGQLSDPRRQDGEWWDRRSQGRVALEHLFAIGAVAGWRTPNFERVYDIPERVIPAPVLAQPTPTTEEAQRELLLSSARSLGVATVSDLAAYYYIRPKAAAARVAELVESGSLVSVQVDGWRDAAYTTPDVRVRRPTRPTATLLSPFDSLIWERSRTSRLFGFDYTIEVYVPEPKRVYGYYVMPLLVGDELVARFDLKSDRKVSALRVRGAYAEPGADPAAIAPAAVAELDALRSWLGLDNLAIASTGNLAPALRQATVA
ncbi:MAG: crosslink repair DNA glycosylase YcaQ family protein [Actinomycetota bacterium]|nr:crosslink repair DNA glycosylase YcaQ family protein [Actinomycetota bacterium]